MRAGLGARVVDGMSRRVRAARRVNEAFNSWNKQNTAALVKEEDCHFIVDLSAPRQAEKHYEESPDWEVVLSHPFLDTSSSRFPFKSFYIPKFSPARNAFNQYLLLRSKSRVAKREQHPSA